MLWLQNLIVALRDFVSIVRRSWETVPSVLQRVFAAYLVLLVLGSVAHYAIAWKYPGNFRSPDEKPGIPELPRLPHPSDPKRTIPKTETLFPILVPIAFFFPLALRPIVPLLQPRRRCMVISFVLTLAVVAATPYVTGPETSIDCWRALGTSFYFAVIALTTVGFGDIYPWSAGARAVVSMEVLFSAVLFPVFVQRALSLVSPVAQPIQPQPAPQPTGLTIEDRIATLEQRVNELDAKVRKLEGH